MKAELTIFFLMFSLPIFAQSKFFDGYKKGYQRGYCYDAGIGCIAPIPPVSLPIIGESLESYEDGYGNGFNKGIEDRKNPSSNKRQRYTATPYEFESAVQKITMGDVLKLVPILKAAKERALEFSENGDFISAIKLAKSALKISSRDPEFMMIVAIGYLELENYTDGLVYLKKAVVFNQDPEVKTVIKEIESGEYQKNIERNKD